MLRTRAPVAAKVLLPRAAPRLACVKPIASVHPEPGSNSPLLFTIFVFFLLALGMMFIDPYSPRYSFLHFRDVRNDGLLVYHLSS